MRTPERTASSPRPARHALRVGDPAELLAEATVGFGSVIRDSLVLLGLDAEGSGAVLTRLLLDPIPVEDCTEELEGLIGRCREQGATGAFGVLVLRDGYEEGPDELDIAEAVRFCAMVLITAGRTQPAPFRIPELWVLAAGRARAIRVRPVPEEEGEPEAVDILLRDPQDLARVDSTYVAAQAVAEGTALPAAHPERDAALERARPQIAAARGRRPVLPVDLAWERALEALTRLGRGIHAPGGAAHVTDCEHVAAFLDICDERDGIDAVCSLFPPRAAAAPGIADDPVGAMISDPSHRPCERIRAGGHWYEALESLRLLSRPEPSVRGRRDGAGAWITLSHVLALLAWWNCRYGTAGDLIHEVLALHPEDRLALYLREMARVPIPPAWQPGP